VAGPDVEVGGGLLNRLGRRALAGERFTVGRRIAVGSGKARVGAVHPIQYELETFNTWHNLRGAGVLGAPALSALQVFLPPSWFCRCHQRSQPDLGDPGVRLGREAA
jgi:hypothetical protein